MNWKELIKAESSKEYYQNLQINIVAESEHSIIYPSHRDMFTAFKLTPLDQVKVVILGQDPYHGVGQAHGLSFSVGLDCDVPPSLRNIYKEINSDLGVSHKFPHGNLTSWAQQGVLLLNTVLTVRANVANSHRNMGWETFTDKVIQTVNEQDRPLVYMLWGSAAKSKRGLVTNSKHLTLESAHPSPLSAYNGFFGCKHFSKANEYLTINNIDPIDWLIQ